MRLILQGVRLILVDDVGSHHTQISDSKTSFGPNFKIRPPPFFQNWFGPEEPRRRLGHGKSTNGQLAHSMAPRGGSLPVAPARGSLPGAQAGGNLPVAPAEGLCF